MAKKKPKDKEEQVLVVPREMLFGDRYWQGFLPQSDKKSIGIDWLGMIKKYGGFMSRDKAETDKAWQQIIPQILFRHKDRAFVHCIKSDSEERLAKMWPIFIGGHINPIDDASTNVLEAGMRREWDEEVSLNGNVVEENFLGIINDDTNDVGQVHVGLAYEFLGDSASIKSNSPEVGDGQMMSLAELKQIEKKLTYWSQIVLPYLEF